MYVWVVFIICLGLGLSVFLFYSVLFLFVCVVAAGFFVLLLVLGFLCLFSFHCFGPFFSSCYTMRFVGSWYPGQGLTWASNVEMLSPGCCIAREVRGPGNMNWCLLSQRYPS